MHLCFEQTGPGEAPEITVAAVAEEMSGQTRIDGREKHEHKEGVEDRDEGLFQGLYDLLKALEPARSHARLRKRK